MEEMRAEYVKQLEKEEQLVRLEDEAAALIKAAVQVEEMRLSICQTAGEGGATY